MGVISCLYCGAIINDDVANCPRCGGVSHFQKRGYRFGARKRFVIFFILLALTTLLLALLLPR